MPIVREDKHGLHVSGEGWRCREVVPGTTRFKVGDVVKTHHFGGSVRVGVGKDETCKRGEYLEYWMTAGGCASSPLADDEGEVIQWYREQFSDRF